MSVALSLVIGIFSCVAATAQAATTSTVENTVKKAKISKLFVNNVNVLKSKDMNDVLGDGSVSYDAETQTLTLSSATLSTGLTGSSAKKMESPIIYFKGDLTIHLIGNNTLISSYNVVKKQDLIDNAIYGDNLVITADPDATLSINGMIQVNSYQQYSGTVRIELKNDHSKITKWSIYAYSFVKIHGGTLIASSVGIKQNGAVMLDDDAFTVASEAVISEGDGGFDTSVDHLTIDVGQSANTKNYISITLPDIAQ